MCLYVCVVVLVVYKDIFCSVGAKKTVERDEFLSVLDSVLDQLRL